MIEIEIKNYLCWHCNLDAKITALLIAENTALLDAVNTGGETGRSSRKERSGKSREFAGRTRQG